MTLTKSYLPKEADIKRKWHSIDATGKALGRLATQAVALLRGKNKVYFTPHLDCGDFVVVTNAAKTVLTGKKLEQKIDYRHSGYPGGDRYTPYAKLMAEKPEKAILLAVKGMLPKTRLGKRQLTRLKVYRGSDHPHAVQFAGQK